MTAILKRVFEWLREYVLNPALDGVRSVRTQTADLASTARDMARNARDTARAAAARVRALPARTKKILLAAAAAVVLIGAAAILYQPDGITMPQSSYGFMHGTYENAERQLREAGFEHIEIVKEFHDAQWNNMWATSGDVVSVKIRGKDVVEGRVYPEDSVVVITYYAFE